MTLPELGIKHHVMTYMVGFAIILFGLVSFSRVGVDELPSVDFPLVMVLTTQSGADANIIDTTITSKLLENLNGITGIDTLTGTSVPSTSQIMLVFNLDKDIDVAFSEVQTKVNQSLSSLPTGVDAPIIVKASSNSDSILNFTISGNRNIQQLDEFATEVVKKQIETTEGVSDIDVKGDRERKIRVELNVSKLAAYGLDVSTVTSAIKSSQVQLPGGYLVSDKDELVLSLDFETHNFDDIKNIVIKNNNGAFVKLSDVATIIDGVEDFRKYSSYNGQTSITLGVNPIAGASAFNIEKEILERMNTSIMPALEPGINISLTMDTVTYIKASVAALEEHIYLGVFLTGVIVYIFLRNLVPTIIIGVTIPIALLGSCVVIYVMGYTFNTITLLGLLLLIGLVVDDAIIVLENIYSKMEEGKNKIEASVSGSLQVTFAVLASTMSLVAIFGSVVFMDGIVGKFFKSFSVVVTCGVLISYFVSLYITPMMCSRYLKISHKESFIKKGMRVFFEKLEHGYANLLVLVLRFRWIVVLIAILCFATIFKASVATEFVAAADKSQINIVINAPTSTNIYTSMQKAQEVEKILKSYPEIKGVNTSIGSGNISLDSVNVSKMKVVLVPLAERNISQADFVLKLRERFSNFVGANIAVSNGGGVGGGNYAIEFNLVNRSLDDLAKYSDILAKTFATTPGIGAAKQSMESLAQLRFVPDRDKIALLGLTSQSVANAISVAIAGSNVAKFNEVGSNIRSDILVKGDDKDFTNPQDLSQIYLKTPSNALVTLGSVVKTERFVGYSSIQRSGSLYSNKFSLNPSLPLGDAMSLISKITNEKLPSGFEVQYTGASKEMQKTVKNMITVFILAIMLLYMVLASQFNSFLQPLILMVPVPLAIVGGVWALNLLHVTLNIFSMIGMVLLVGLVAKNSILLIDFTNQHRAEGKTVKEALLIACPERLRAILMTSLTVILSMLPAVISHGVGSENNRSLSVVVVGGMISSTLLTLFIIPSVYSLVEGFFEKRANKKAKKNQKELKEVESSNIEH